MMAGPKRPSWLGTGVNCDDDTILFEIARSSDRLVGGRCGGSLRVARVGGRMIATRTGHWLRTFSGKRYFPADPHPDDVCLEDVAHALSLLCRYGGHCSRFYSVAEHSVLVSYMVPERHALSALLHDATEAYCVDLPRPLKMELPAYQEIERVNWLAIAEHFDLPLSLHPSIKQADIDCCVSEMAVLMPGSGNDYCIPGAVHRDGIVLKCYGHIAAELLFLERFREVTA